MASPEFDIAVGLSLAATGDLASLASREIEDFTLPAAEGDTIQSSHQGTTAPGPHSYIATDLYDPGSIELTLHHWQDLDYWALIGKSDTLTFTLPSGATIAFTGILTSYTPQGSRLNEQMLADATIKVSGSVTVTAAL
jgi:hypothetical protein